MNASDKSLLKTKERFIIIHCSWNAWEKLSNKDVAYLVKQSIEDFGSLQKVNVNVYDDETKEYIEVQ